MISYKIWKILKENMTLGTEIVDARQLDAAYDKAKYAVRLVQLYDATLPADFKLLLNISTIATLNQGVYGMYASSEDRKVIGPQALAKLRLKFGDEMLRNRNIERLPAAVIRQYVPDIDMKQIKPSDVIHVNVQKHLQTHGDSLNAVLEIASTIVHECTHELEKQRTGTTSEVGPVQAEKRFMEWVRSNWNTILQRIPQLKELNR